jgi:hypothetical protein
VHRACFLAALFSIPCAAAVCSETDFQGAYGFQLSGNPTISGLPAPMASIGRLVLEADEKLSGISSVNFNGFFLGNPVTGTYKIQTDCSMTFQLQDDSGAWQHFAGQAQPGGAHIDFHQTDPGTTESHGVMERTPPACDDQSLSGRYALTISGRDTPYGTAGETARLSAETTAEADGAGNLALTWTGGKTAGSYSVDSDCTAEISIGIAPNENAAELIGLRGVVVNGGKEILAVQTDPERVSVAKLVR